MTSDDLPGSGQDDFPKALIFVAASGKVDQGMKE
jgi:hypothetical protein